MVLLVLKLSKCRSIVVSEPSKRRRELAKTFGADYTYNPLECDLAQECKQVAGSQGVQVVFDCAGIPSAFNSALNIMQKRSIFVTIAMWSPDRPATFNPSLLMAKEITLTGRPVSLVGSGLSYTYNWSKLDSKLKPQARWLTRPRISGK